MTARAIAAAAAIAMLLPAGGAQAADSCVWVRNINDFKPAQDEKSLIIRDSPSRRYNVSLVGRCTGLRFTETLAVRAVGGMFCLTPGDSISFSDSGMRQVCMIAKIEKIEPGAAAAPASDTPQAETQESPEGY